MDELMTRLPFNGLRLLRALLIGWDNAAVVVTYTGTCRRTEEISG